MSNYDSSLIFKLSKLSKKDKDHLVKLSKAELTKLAKQKQQEEKRERESRPTKMGTLKEDLYTEESVEYLDILFSLDDVKDNPAYRKGKTVIYWKGPDSGWLIKGEDPNYGYDAWINKKHIENIIDIDPDIKDIIE